MRTAALLSAEDFERVAPILGPCELVKGEIVPIGHLVGEMEQKVAEYLDFGVDLVWVLDPQTLTLRAYRRGAPPDLVRDTDTVTADPHVPAFTTPVKAFFEN